MTRVVSSLEELVGDTPTLQLSYPDLPARLLAKLEMFNPLSSVKDRAALHMIRSAERSGVLRAGVTVVEATSGNTGISLAALCAVRGYRCVLVMPDNATEERRRILRAFGAELVLSPFQDGLVGTMTRARTVAASIPGVGRRCRTRASSGWTRRRRWSSRPRRSSPPTGTPRSSVVSWRICPSSLAAAELFRVLRPGGRFINADQFCRVMGPAGSPERASDGLDLLTAKARYYLGERQFRTDAVAGRLVAPVHA
jgi:cysteine synthase